MSIGLTVLGARTSFCRDRCRLPRPFKRRVFVLLFVAGMLGVIAVLPFAVDLLGSLAIDRTASDMPMPLVLTLALVQNGILLAAAIAIGLVLSERIGLQMPLIHDWAAGAHSPNVKAVVVPGVLVGAAAGAVLVSVEALFFLRHLPGPMQSLFEIPLWKRLLAGLVYGGITEELLMRLFLMTLVAWTLGRWWKTPAGIPGPWGILGGDHHSGGSFRVRTSPRNRGGRSLDASARNACAGAQRRGWSRLWLSVLETRP